MYKKRLTLWLTLLSVAIIVMAGCAPRATSGEILATADTEDLVVDLPALVIDINSEGQPSVGNVPVSQISSMVPAETLESMVIPQETVTFLTESNIQHIQIDNTSNGLLLLVNGEPIPSIKWNGEILSGTATLVNELGAGVAVLEDFLPLLTNVGVGVIVRFPLQEGVAEIPTFVEGGEAAMAARQAQEEFLEKVGGTPPTIQLPVFYDSEGGWRVGDLTDAEWTNLTGLPFQAARLDPAMIQSMMQAGITEISVYTTPEGLHISINEHALPYIGWADGEINHLLNLGDQLELWDTLADNGMNMGEIIGMVEQLLPIVQSTDTSINVYFPESMAAANQ